MNRRIIIASLLLFSLFFIGVQAVNYATEERDIISSFGEVEFKIDKSYVNTWAKIDVKDAEYSVDKICVIVANAVGLEEPYEFKYENNSNSESCTISKAAVDIDTSIKVNKDNDEPRFAYVMINFQLNNKHNASYKMQTLAESVMNDFGGLPSSNLTVEGYYQGNIFIDDKVDYVIDELDSYLNIKFAEEIRTESFYNTYGYTRRIEDHIVFGGNKVNIDLALTYDDIKDITTLYIGTPVISVEY